MAWRTVWGKFSTVLLEEDEMIYTYESKEVAKTESILKAMELNHRKMQVGTISRKEYFTRWYELEKQLHN